MCNQIVCIPFKVCLCTTVCVAFINIPESVSINVHRVCYVCITCQCVLCIYTCHVSASSCPYGAAMLRCSASSLISPISLWFAASYTHDHKLLHVYTNMYTDAVNTGSHTCYSRSLFVFQEKEAETYSFIYCYGCGAAVTHMTLSKNVLSFLNKLLKCM